MPNTNGNGVRRFWIAFDWTTGLMQTALSEPEFGDAKRREKMLGKIEYAPVAQGTTERHNLVSVREDPREFFEIGYEVRADGICEVKYIHNLTSGKKLQCVAFYLKQRGGFLYALRPSDIPKALPESRRPQIDPALVITIKKPLPASPLFAGFCKNKKQNPVPNGQDFYLSTRAKYFFEFNFDVV